MTVQPAPSPIEELRLGALIVAGPDASPLPLEHTDVVAQVSGPLASVAVTQRFGNPFGTPVELAYLFPLPHGAAIVDFELRIGARHIRADLQELEAARQTYATAREQGRRAGLLEQRRPNLFALQIANVQPGETILATVRYHERLRYDDGDYQFVFPMGITPKFHAEPAEAKQVDAPLAAAGEPIGTVDLSLAVDAGGPAGDPRSPSHPLAVTRVDERRFSVILPGTTIPNKDFVLRYAVAGETLRAAAWSASAEGGATALITALPPRLTAVGEPAPREFVFVLDRSGSMSGGPLSQARNALRACLRALGPDDAFAIQAFDDQIEWLATGAQPVTQAAVEQADAWLSALHARGGTDILSAIDAALQLPADPARQRYVVFLTDGAVSAHDEALRRVERQLGRTRLFTFGIGPSVNRALLARLADLGRGTAEFLQLDEDIEEAIIRFQDRVGYPVLQDLNLEWDGLRAWDIYPERLPDLYAGQPLELVARIQPSGAGGGRLTIRGRRGDEPLALTVDLPAPAGPDPAVTRAWARARVDALLDQSRSDRRREGTLRGEIIGLALQHRLLTPYTAFVAVDSEVTAAGEGKPRRVEVSVPLPEGLDIEGFFGGPQVLLAGMAMMAPPSPASLSKRRAGPPQAMLGAGREALRGIRDMFASKSAEPEADRVAAHLAAPDDTEPAAGEAGGREGLLRRLARTQNVSGSWGQGAGELEQTAAAVLAFVRAGHTTRSGHYRRQLSRAIQWLLGARGGGASDPAEHARAQALLEMAAATGDARLRETAEVARAPLAPLAPPPAGTLHTLAALRAAALAGRPAPLDPALLRGRDAELARLWQAVLRAGNP
jgi:Ca-activated chloride channel family protein